MPKDYDHREKRKHIREFYCEPVFSGDKYNDWYVIALFYEALHAVEERMYAHGKHCGSHSERREQMKGFADLAPIAAVYDDLRDIAQQARYYCVKIANNQVIAAQEDVRVILKQLEVK